MVISGTYTVCFKLCTAKASLPLKNKLYTNETIISLQLTNSNEPSLRVLEHN